jgi:phosphoserine phosphatase RsbU/P
MLSNIKIKSLLLQYKHYLLLFYIFIFSVLIFKIAGIYQHSFTNFMNVATYLTWHNIFEFVSILVSFTVFSVSYFSYNQTGRLRSVFLGNIFLLTGTIDAFHTLSFKGMPDFFIPNMGANRATTFWIIARLIGAIGFIITSFIPNNKKSKINKMLFIIPSIIISFTTFITVTYFSNILPKMYDEVRGLTEIKIVLEYLIIVILLIAIIKFVHEYNKTKDFLIILFVGALLLSIFSELAFVSYKNDVHHIYNYLGHVYKIIAFSIIFRVIFIYNVQMPYKKLSEAKDELRSYAENLDKIVDKRTHELKRMNQKFLDDLEYARDIQKAVLPARLPKETEVSFCAKYFPAESVGGDFYNVFKLDEDNIGIYVGDVAGHGVPAAMLSVFINQSIKSLREFDKNRTEIITPSLVLKNLYESFNMTNFKDNIYVVLLYCVYNIKTRKLTYASAGLNAEPIIIKNTGEVYNLCISGFPICKFIEFYNEDYIDSYIELDEGDKILFYTDGLVDAERHDGLKFCDINLNKLIKKNLNQNCSELSNSIEKGVFEFIDNNVIKDDITFVIMEVN